VYVVTVSWSSSHTCHVMVVVLHQSLPRRQGLRPVGSFRQLAALHQGTVHEELRDNSPPTTNSRVYFDVGDDISYVSSCSCDLNHIVCSKYVIRLTVCITCHPAICLQCANRSLITLVVVTYARQHVVILLFQPQGRSDTVLAALSTATNTGCG